MYSSDLIGPPPPVAPPMVGSGDPDYSRGGPSPYGVAQPAMGGGRMAGSGIGTRGGFSGYPPFQPGVGSGFDIGRGGSGGGGRGRGFSGRGGGGRMSNGTLGARRGDLTHGSGGRGFDSARGGSRDGDRSFGGRSGGRSSDGGRGGGRSFGSGRGGGGRGFDGGRGGGRGGRHGGSRGDLDNIALPKQDFGNLVPFEKNFYIECPSVRAMSEQDVLLYRSRRDITVEGHDVPRPIRLFQEANFPGIIRGHLIK